MLYMFHEKQYSFSVAAVDSFKMGSWEVTIGPTVWYGVDTCGHCRKPIFWQSFKARQLWSDGKRLKEVTLIAWQ